ncbi:SSI family serine proteinase inhibitor [Glycomyces sp. YM15]|uniref:SSI family serine proteinase inhibitor n=1 Tax=Glycomyces sp. YM15 TaxID=2800446 RepID=UPI001963E1EC|nr:SSI family serine proteinase inhibitor [Glycomyces sp. YM15]
MKQLVVGALAAAAFATVGSGSAQAAFQPFEPMPVDPGIGDGSGPHSHFAISMTPLRGGGPVQITLDCPPELSEHPNADTVCSQLDEADGHVGDIPAADGMCTKEYAPVRVLVFGHWQGQPRAFTETYGNQCEAVLATGGALLDL